MTFRRAVLPTDHLPVIWVTVCNGCGCVVLDQHGHFCPVDAQEGATEPRWDVLGPECHGRESKAAESVVGRMLGMLRGVRG